MRKGVGLAVLILMCTVAFSNNITAQYTVQHQQPTVLDRNTSNQLEFFVPGVTELTTTEAYLFYRNEGDLGYSQKEIFLSNGVFVANISAEELVGTTFEYYFQLSIEGENQDFFYPDNLPSENPIQVSIVDGTGNSPVQSQRKQATNIDYNILSPQPGNGLAPEDVYIAVALYYDKSELEPGSFKLYVNEIDVTADADTSEYFIAYTANNPSRGLYTVRLDYVTETEPLEVVQWQFSVVRPGQASSGSLRPNLLPEGRVELTARNQTIAGDLNNAYTARSFVSGSYGQFSYALNGFLTSQESNRLQPQNRYALELNLGKWWNFEVGHVYPRLSTFTISGRRIEGINTSLHLLWETVNVQFVYGELNRKITNRYSTIVAEDVFLESNPDSVLDRTYTLSYQDGGRGTFDRKIIAGRVALGNPRHFQIGIQAMKVEDDTSSIFNVIDYLDVLASPTSLLGNLTLDDQQRLSGEPELLQVAGGSPRPKGNFVTGIDMSMGFDRNRVRFKTETVASVLTNDIYGGPLDSLAAADLGFEDIDQSDLDILDDISRLIIINENVNVLPIRVTGINTDSTDYEIFFPTGVLASNTELLLNYPVNTFSLKYIWVGPEFNSLANSTIRKDIAGFTALDRFRLFQNQLYVTLGFEALTDNVTNTKEATTGTNTFRTNLSWYPQDIRLPRVSVGFRYRKRDNGVERFNSLVPSGLELAAVQNLRIVDGDTLITTTPRLNTTRNLDFSITQQVELMDMIHDATISVSSLNTEDEVYAFGDVQNTAFSLNITSRFVELPLRTQFGMTFNNTESGSGQLEIDIFGMYAGGSYFLLDGKLNINGRLAFTSNTSTSRVLEVLNNEDDSFLNDYYVLSNERTTNDFATVVLLAGAEYTLAENHSLIFDSNFTNVTGSNSINDRVVQLRYIYRF
ncbi:MAG: hypothetical protein MI700_11930 [Balneolales bacterium]|nr:hypothetical protein [Balneolales bacterium]